MTAIDDTLARLRAGDPLASAGIGPGDGDVHDDLRAAGVRFAAPGSPLEARWHRALSELRSCIRPVAGSTPVLTEGGNYPGSWLESTATISAEVLSRFVPSVTTSTTALHAESHRSDGLLPYKVIDSGPAFNQIQLVTPLARTVWHHYLLNGRDRAHLRSMYDAMAGNDAWLAAHRDTRGSGGVEAFCTFDTGHDLSPRFWFVPDRCPGGDPTVFDTGSPWLPYIAPDLTANVACQRRYLALIADELGEDGDRWRELAEVTLAALWEQCWDETDAIFYDRAADGGFVKVASDVLLRVLACEVGDDDFFAAALSGYLLNTRKFLAPFGFTSLAMDDPRFDHDYGRNSWGGPVNFLSLIRAPHAFEHHGRVAELALTQAPVLAALAAADRFPQCLDPWTGAAGFTSGYSPAILWLLDAVERYCGVLPRPDGEVWLSGMPPARLGHAAAAASGYTRRVAGVEFELVVDEVAARVWRDGAAWLEFPAGWRVVARDGRPVAVVGLAAGSVAGDLVVDGVRTPLTLAPNQRVELADGSLTDPGFTAPRW